VNIVFFSPRQFQVFPKLERLDTNRLARCIQESPPPTYLTPGDIIRCPTRTGDPYSGRPGPDRTGPNRTERPAENSPHPHPLTPSTNVQTSKPSSSSSKKNVSFYFQPLPRLPCMSTPGRTSPSRSIDKAAHANPPLQLRTPEPNGETGGKQSCFRLFLPPPGRAAAERFRTFVVQNERAFWSDVD
jgi:hypothetical protein